MKREGQIDRLFFRHTPEINQTNYNNYLTTTIMAYVIGDSCIACGTCQSVCPVDAISEGDIYHIDPDTCISCGSCAQVCPNDAITEG